MSIETLSGNINSSVGEVEHEEHGPEHSLRAALGDGDASIHLESFSGDVNLQHK